MLVGTDVLDLAGKVWILCTSLGSRWVGPENRPTIDNHVLASSPGRDQAQPEVVLERVIPRMTDNPEFYLLGLVLSPRQIHRVESSTKGLGVWLGRYLLEDPQR